MTDKGNKGLNKPIFNTLWEKCFWEVVDRCNEDNVELVEFKDVDELVLEKSKITISELLDWLVR